MKRKASPAPSDADHVLRSLLFMQAVTTGDVDKVRKMVKYGYVKDLDAKLGVSSRSALTMATDAGNVDMVRALLELGADVNAKEHPPGRQLLTRAVDRGHEEVVKVLAAAGADLRSIECVDAFIRWVKRGPCDYDDDGATVKSMVSTFIDLGMHVNAMGTAGVHALTAAVANDDEAMTRLLLQKGADVNALNADGYTALMRAVNDEHERLVRILLEGGADVNSRSDAGDTALMFAVETGNNVLVRMLIDAGADVNALDYGGFTALMFDECQDETKRILLDAGAIRYDEPRPALDHYGADHPRDKCLKSSLHLKVLHGNVNEVCLTLASNPHLVNKNIHRGLKTETPLISASLAGDVAMVKELINHGADVNKVSDWMVGDSPLICACAGGHTATVSALLLAGANVNAKTKQDGKTALMYAIQERSESVVRLLLHGGADVNARDEFGSTALHIAAGKAGYDSMVRLLIASGADVNARDKNGETALFSAASCLRESNLRALIAANGNVNDINGTGVTPLMEVVGTGYTHPEAHPGAHREVLRLLLASGADVNAQDDSGMTALMHFVSNEDYNFDPETMFVFDMLLTHNVGSLDVNARDNSGCTALMMAARDVNACCITALINAGADVNLRDEYGCTALMIAVENGDLGDEYDDVAREISETLVKAGALPYQNAVIYQENVRAQPAPALAPAPVETPMQKSLLACMSVLDEHASDIPEGAYLAITRELQNVYRAR